MTKKSLLNSGLALVLMGVTGLLISKGRAQERSVKPNPQIAPGPYGPYQGDFNLDVLAAGSSLEQYPARGKIYIEAVKGSDYELRITNPLPVRVAVALSVDGLNTIDARHTTARDAAKWVIEPYGTTTVSGWQMSSSRARRFYFTGEHDSYATKLGKPSDQGEITAVFFQERVFRPFPVTPVPVTPMEQQGRVGSGAQSERSQVNTQQSNGPAAPASKAKAANGGAASSTDEYAATGIGHQIDNDVRWVRMEYEPAPVATIVIRYEYHDALVRLGVLPPVYPAPEALSRREHSSGFAGHAYCPEP